MRHSLDCTNSLATFLLQKEAQEKSYQKRTPKGEFRALRSATNARALDRRKLLKKLDQNFHQPDETRLFCLQTEEAPSYHFTVSHRGLISRSRCIFQSIGFPIRKEPVWKNECGQPCLLDAHRAAAR